MQDMKKFWVKTKLSTEDCSKNVMKFQLIPRYCTNSTKILNIEAITNSDKMTQSITYPIRSQAGIRKRRERRKRLLKTMNRSNIQNLNKPKKQNFNYQFKLTAAGADDDDDDDEEGIQHNSHQSVSSVDKFIHNCTSLENGSQIKETTHQRIKVPLTADLLKEIRLENQQLITNLIRNEIQKQICDINLSDKFMKRSEFLSIFNNEQESNISDKVMLSQTTTATTTTTTAANSSQHNSNDSIPDHGLDLENYCINGIQSDEIIHQRHNPMDDICFKANSSVVMSDLGYYDRRDESNLTALENRINNMEKLLLDILDVLSNGHQNDKRIQKIRKNLWNWTATDDTGEKIRSKMQPGEKQIMVTIKNAKFNDDNPTGPKNINYYQIRQRNFNLLHYKKSDQTLQLNKKPDKDSKAPTFQQNTDYNLKSKMARFIKTALADI